MISRGEFIKHEPENSVEPNIRYLRNRAEWHTFETTNTAKRWISQSVQPRAVLLKVFEGRNVRVWAMVMLGIVMILGSANNGDAQQLQDAFRKVQQSVVVIRTQQTEPATSPQNGMVNLDGLGSGVLISNDGKVLTAAHLVQAADTTVVEFSDGELIPARVTGAAMEADVALLQLQHNPSNAAPAVLGDSDKAEVGEEVFVIGAPYGLSHTLTAGHISGRHRPDDIIGDTHTMELLQTDAAINQGNSGGPMFNMRGEVIGIVTNIMSKSGGSEGLGFAATSNLARQLLLEQKPFWSGIEGILVKGDLAEALNVSQPGALLVQRVAAGSPAARAGVRAGSVRANIGGQDLILGGDIILAINGLAFDATDTSYARVYASLSTLKPGDKLEIKIVRHGQVRSLSVPVNQ